MLVNHDRKIVTDQNQMQGQGHDTDGLCRFRQIVSFQTDCVVCYLTNRQSINDIQHLLTDQYQNETSIIHKT